MVCPVSRRRVVSGIRFLVLQRKMMNREQFALVLSGLLMFGGAQAVPVPAVDFDGLSLGATIVGPVGPTVDTTFVDAGSGNGIGDLVSGVICPAGISPCAPPTNPAGTIYTYFHQVTPGIDTPNDAPFPAPGTIVPLDGVTGFSLGFAAAGFNGIAGFSFGEAAAAVTQIDDLVIDLSVSGELSWTLPTVAGWDTGETITLFWQTTQPPSGPGGQYNLANPSLAGAANGPLPVPVPTIEVSEPGSLALLLLVGLTAFRRQAIKC